MKRALCLLSAGLFLRTLVAAPAPELDRSLSDFPRQAGETDDAARIQRAVDATAFGVLHIPAGLYTVSSPIFVRNRCSLELHKTAVLRAVKPMEFVVWVDVGIANKLPLPKGDFRSCDRNLFVTGGKIDGNGLASCLCIVNPFHFTLRDTTFLNGKAYGLKTSGGCEVIGQNLYFQCDVSGLAGNTAAYLCGGDSHYTDCVVVDYTVGFRNANGSNRFTRCHVWGGPVPAPKPGEEREMLKDSICFWNEGGDAVFRDCYADTGKTGYRIDAMTQLFGCRYYNNRWFKLDDITVIDHRKGTLLVADCHFMDGGTPKIRIYRPSGLVQGKAVWRDWQCSSGFEDLEKLPGRLDFEFDQECPTADDWDFLNGSRYVLACSAGELRKRDCVENSFSVSRNRMNKRFPNAGPGKNLVVRARATDAVTREVEITLHHKGGKVWGTQLRVTQDWKDIVVPLEQLRYFSHWKVLPPLQEGDRPDARLLTNVRFCFGKWLCQDSLDAAHGIEIESVRITGR